MACASCAQRRALAVTALQKLRTGQPVAPQVKQFAQTVRRDFASVRSAISPAVAAATARLGIRRP